MFGLKTWRRRRVLRNTTLPDELWHSLLAGIAITRNLSADEKQRLRDLVVLFLYEKEFSGAGEFEITDRVRLVVAIQACMIILNLGIDYYTGWSSIIVYPSLFRPRRSYTDEYGVVHQTSRILSGEAWNNGPLILSWDEVEEDLHTQNYGGNVVIHEFAHKLDMLNGAANGMPPLHKTMNLQSWAQDFSAVYENFCEQVENGELTVVDPYAAENPAEFFAVMSEGFFILPESLNEVFPEVYAQLKAFYRQDPLAHSSHSKSVKTAEDNKSHAVI